MDRPLFSEMLLDRRRQLGLSIKQASNVLRLKEEVLIAFEEGDFDSIPKSGYAQGMLSSYARYLGLNAKTVVNQFSQDLFEHERGAGSHEARRRSRRNRVPDEGPLYEVPQAAALRQGRSMRTYVESHGFLPTSGGFAGDMGEFATTSSPRPRIAGSPGDDYEDAYPQGRPYTSRVPVSAASPLGQSQRQRPTTRGSSYAQQDAYELMGRPAEGSFRSSGDITTRRVAPAQYRDDMRLDNDGGSYQLASSADGRRSSRNIASTQRPNVRRRSSTASRAQARGRDMGQGGAAGLLGLVQAVFQQRSSMIALIIALLAIVLTVTIVFSVSSCVGSRETTPHSVAVSATQDEDGDEGDKNDMTDEEEQRARDEAAAAKAAESEASTAERTIEVTVADGEVTWLEVEYDGTSDIAETVTGPWNRTYTVRQSISINVNDTSAVTVTENGKKLEFDSKASGIGTISIQVSKAGSTDGGATDEASGSATGEAGGQGQADATSAGDAPQQTTQQQTAPQPTYDSPGDGSASAGGGTGTVIYDGYTLDEDGYYYGADGYYDANGNFYSY